jgi:2-amino-4-hydroxy-6-hydroxymethyldihydropteridine diphosphokinase
MNGIEAGLSLGANLGDSLATLRAARDAIAALPEVTLLASSPLYQTDPIGVPEEFVHVDFLNAVVIVGTSLDAHKLFARMQKIETDLGRKRTLRPNTPRNIDIDLIYYDGQTIRSGGLVIPHPRWTKRRFVLQPLADVRDYLVLPGHDRRVRDILANLPPGQDVAKVLEQW